jgi:hypothetical protein
MGRGWHVARTGDKIILTGFWWESEKKRDNYEGLHIGERIILKWI